MDSQLFAADSDVLLGAQMLCPRATDMIGELATAIANGLTSRQLMYAMRAHPTFNEAVSGAVEDSRRRKAAWQINKCCAPCGSERVSRKQEPARKACSGVLFIMFQQKSY